MFGKIKIISIFFAALPMLGCANAGLIGGSELTIYNSYSRENLLGSVLGYATYAEELAELYISESDQVSIAQDAFAVGIIGAAATAAGGVIYGSHLDLVKGAGLAAGTTGALNSFVKPKESSIALLNAADKLICVAKSGRSVAPELKAQQSDDANSSARQIMDSAIREARIALRKALIRDVPDYGTVLNKIQSAAQNEQNKKEASNGTPEKVLATLQSEIDKCLLIPGS